MDGHSKIKKLFIRFCREEGLTDELLRFTKINFKNINLCALNPFDLIDYLIYHSGTYVGENDGFWYKIINRWELLLLIYFINNDKVTLKKYYGRLFRKYTHLHIRGLENLNSEYKLFDYIIKTTLCTEYDEWFKKHIN